MAWPRFSRLSGQCCIATVPKCCAASPRSNDTPAAASDGAEWSPFGGSGHLGGCGAEVSLPFYCAARRGPRVCLHVCEAADMVACFCSRAWARSSLTLQPCASVSLSVSQGDRPGMWNLGRPCLSKADGHGSTNDTWAGRGRN